MDTQNLHKALDLLDSLNDILDNISLETVKDSWKNKTLSELNEKLRIELKYRERKNLSVYLDSFENANANR